MSLGLDGLQVGGTQVERHRFDRSAALGSKLSEELIEGLGVASLRSPDDAAPVVVDDQGQVFVVLAPGDLVDTDAEQPVETTGIEFGGDDPPAGSADGAPTHPAQSGDRGLVHPGRQPSEEIVEVAGQVRAGTGEGDRFNDHPMRWAAKPTQGRFDLHSPHPEIQVPPPRRTRPGVVAIPGLVPAMRADQPPASQRYDHGDHVQPESDRGDVHAVEAQKPLECSSDAHGRGTSQSSRCRNHELWSRTVRVTRTRPYPRSPSQHKRHATRPPTQGSGEPTFRTHGFRRSSWKTVGVDFAISYFGLALVSAPAALAGAGRLTNAVLATGDGVCAIKCPNYIK